MSGNLARYVFLGSVLCLVFSNSFAQRYWVNDSGDGRWNNSANWALTPGGLGGAGIPTPAQDVFFTSDRVSNCNININATARTVTIESGYTGVVTLQTNKTLILTRTSAGSVTEGIFSIAGGTFQGTNEAIFVKYFKMSGGVFNSTSGTLYVGGNMSGIYSTQSLLDISGGSFNANGGTVKIDVSTSQSGMTYQFNGVTSSFHFNNLWIEPTIYSGQTAKFTPSGAGATVVVDGDLTLVYGHIKNDFTLAGNLVTASGYAGVQNGDNFNLTLNGTGTQTYSIDAAAGRLGNLIINKSSGIVQAASGSSTLKMKTFTLTSGTFSAPDFMYIGGDFANVYNPITLFNQTGGTFQYNTSKVTFDVSNPGGTYNLVLDVIGTTNFYDLELNSQGLSICKFLSGNGDLIRVLNDLTLTDGYYAGSYSVERNLVVGSDFDGVDVSDMTNSNSYPYLCDLTFSGANAQTYTFNTSSTLGRLYVNKSGGSVSPVGASPLSAYSLDIASGIFTAPSSTLTIGGSYSNIWSNKTVFSQASGTSFNHNNGTVNFNATTPGGTLTFLIDVDATTEFNNVQFNGPDGYVYATPSGDKIVTRGTLTLSDGILNTTTFESYGDVTVGPNFDGGNAPLVFKGSNAQSFDLTGATSKFDAKVTINKDANDVTLNSALQMDAASQTLTFVNGDLNTTSTNLLIIGDNVTTSGASNTSYVSGPVRKVGNDAFTFPVGDGGFYSPVTITAPSNVTDAFDAEYFFNSAKATIGNGLDPTLKHVSDREYWQLNRSAGASIVTMTMSWLSPARSGDIDAVADLRLAAWDGSQWNNLGASSSGTVGSGTISNVTLPDYTAQKFFTLVSVSEATTLPIVLTSFFAALLDGQVVLNWTTESELNNDYFEVERSLDGKLFEAIGRINGAGTTNHENSYEFVDKNTVSGILYYRLSQVDFDGKSTNSKVIRIVTSFNEINPGIIQTYPNPASRIINVNCKLCEAQVKLVLIDQDLREIRQTYFADPLNCFLAIDDLPSGLYRCKVECDGKHFVSSSIMVIH